MFNAYTMTTPMMTRYWNLQTDAIRSHGEHALVLIEVGAFMEYYATDTDSFNFTNIHKMSKLLNMIITKKDKKIEVGNSNPYMLGFPTNSLSKQLRVLNAHSFTIFIVKQVWDMNKRVIIERNISRIITPSTYYEEPTDSGTYNICCVHSINECTHHVCVVDVSIGKIHTACLTKEDEMNWFLHVYNPVEVLWMKTYETITNWFDGRIVYHKYNPIFFCKSYQSSVFKKVFNSDDVSTLNSKNIPPVICVLDFIWNCHAGLLKSIMFPVDVVHDTLTFYNNAITQLDVIQTEKGKGLLHIIDKTNTPMGKRLLKNQLLNPSTNVDDINLFFTHTKELHLEGDAERVAILLHTLPDMERLLRKLELDSPSFLNLEQIYNGLEVMYVKEPNIMFLTNKTVVHEFIEFVTQNCNFEKKCPMYGASEICDALSDSVVLCKSKLEEYIKQINCPLLKIDRNDCEFFLVTTSKKTQCIDLTKFRLKKMTSHTKVENDDISNLCKDLFDADTQYQQGVQVFFDTTIKHICATFLHPLKEAIRSIAYLDTILSRCMLITHYGYSKPTVVHGESFIDATNLKHPVIDQFKNFTGNSVFLNSKDRESSHENNVNGILLYGLNGSGKSTYSKSVALNLILAQAGFYVCASTFTIAPFKKIFARINCDDNIYQGKSSFIVEVSELKTILDLGDSESLIIGDELCKGTGHVSAVSLVSACIIQLLAKNTKFIFASHLHELPAQLHQFDPSIATRMGIFHLQSTVNKETNTIAYDRLLAHGQGDVCHGLEVAGYFLNLETIQHARQIKSNLEKRNKFIIQPTKSTYNSNKYKDTCELCGSTEQLDVHHLIPQKNFSNLKCHRKKNNLTNLLTLCKRCHIITHQTDTTINQIDTPTGLSIVR